MSNITPTQIRGARGMLDWSMAELADAARLSVSTIKRMEMGTPQSVSDEAYELVRGAFEVAGIRFSGDEELGLEIQLTARRSI